MCPKPPTKCCRLLPCPVAKPKALIIGAGLGGALVAHRLAASHTVVVIDMAQPNWHQQVRDRGHPAITEPHVVSGWGGSTLAWHNGLIEIAPAIFKKYWPFSKQVLQPYYTEAFALLGGNAYGQVRSAEHVLRTRYVAMGVAAKLLPQGLFYPQRRINPWVALGLENRVQSVQARVVKLLAQGPRVTGVKLADGRTLTADVVILAAGGLGTPVLLQTLGKLAPKYAGWFYEDHPFGFVGEVTLRGAFYQLWNSAVRGARGNLRLPLVIEHQGLQISFQLRPAMILQTQNKRDKVVSVLNGLRNQPWHIKNYFKLLYCLDDVVDILSFKLGWRLPTPHYSLMMVAQQPAQNQRSVWAEKTAIIRHWQLDTPYLATLREAMDKLLKELAPVMVSGRIFKGWAQGLQSSSHHSGTARMGHTRKSSVCDAKGQVWGVKGLYVADGSIIPASGFANTGLTIGALALRLGDEIAHQAHAPDNV